MNYFHVDQPMNPIVYDPSVETVVYIADCYDRSKGLTVKRFKTYEYARAFCTTFSDEFIIGGFCSIYVKIYVRGKPATAMMLVSDQHGVATFFQDSKEGLVIRKTPPGDFLNDHLAGHGEDARCGILPAFGNLHWNGLPSVKHLSPLGFHRGLAISRLEPPQRDEYFRNLR